MLPQQRGGDRGTPARRAGGAVAVIDIDAHHGNGTQSIFYDEPGVLVGSVHVDPGAGWFPHFLGFADETGAGDADGANRNVPLPPGSGDDVWLEAIAGLGAWVERDVGGLVVALGVDAAGGDPESPLQVSAEGFRQPGGRSGRSGSPQSSSRRAATTSRRSGRSYTRCWPASRRRAEPPV